MTQEHKNLYEDLIQGMILEGINGMTPELKKLIDEAPVEQKRSMILDIMEENTVEHRIITNKIKNIIKRGVVGEMSHIKEVVKMLREYVKVSDVEVKKYGEIMTPIELVEEMLDTLPHTAWMNPNLKWLDPCNGVGTFISVVVQRLMKGLEWTIPNEEERYKHIMENMIYVCELQPKNVFLYMYAFDPEDKYALNIYNGSYLTEGFNKHMLDLGVEKFDVIVMNPPYNIGEDNRGNAHTLWDKFVLKTIDEVVEGGYLVAVHPDSWRCGGKSFREVNKLLRSKQILYLEIHTKGEGMKTFGANTTYDFYCLQNVPNTTFTKIKGSDGIVERVDISKMGFIPNGMYRKFEKLIAKNGEEKVNYIYSRSAYGNDKEHISKEQTEDFKYPVIYLTYKKNMVIKCRYSNTNKNGHFGIPKVIWTNGVSVPIVDEIGEYGLMNYAYGIADDPKNLPFIKKAMENPEFLELMKNSNGNIGFGHIYDHKVIELFRKDFWMDFI
ncbi:MAG TPA: N-6 DNA methylase [Bacilli bacterium]|nr:N-6 DNA methylase [Bacilli bacterium]